MENNYHLENTLFQKAKYSVVGGADLMTVCNTV